jgi:tRNA A-37 threonylcarbamoyl transferase component Bud32
MRADDQLAEWLVRWEEARAANRRPPALDELPAELHSRARDGLRLLRGFTRMARGLTTTRSAPHDDAPHDNAPQAPPDTPRYCFEAFLARGGMGEVWRGFDTLLARGVALKVVREPVLADAGFRARFEEEARHVSQLEHPSIVPVYDLGELADGRPFFVMKLIHGLTLAQLLAARATPAEDLPDWVEVFERVCQAVAFAHARGLIHRDLKPSNVMLGELGEVQVLDWGIAKARAAGRQSEQGPSMPVVLPSSVDEAAAAPGGSETLTGQVRGTPGFMAPEQARGEGGRVGTASDVFGLGGILCVILTGQPPFTRRAQTAAGDLEEAFARLDGCGADAELIALAKACLAPAQEARPADAAEVAGLVKRYRDEVAARQAESERLLWIRAAGEVFPPDVEAARARFRQQARELLRTEVAAQAQRLSSASPAESAAARQVLESIRGLPGLSGVREPAALADLPEPERQEWQAFWQEVEGLLRSPDPAR